MLRKNGREWHTNGNLHVVLPGWKRRATAERHMSEMLGDANVRGLCVVELPSGTYSVAASALRIGRQWYEFSERTEDDH